MSEATPKLIIDPKLEPHITRLEFNPNRYASGLKYAGMSDDAIDRMKIVLMSKTKRYNDRSEDWPYSSYSQAHDLIALWPQVIARGLSWDKRLARYEDAPEPEVSLSAAHDHVLLRETAHLVNFNRLDRYDLLEQAQIEALRAKKGEKVRAGLFSGALLGSMIGSASHAAMDAPAWYGAAVGAIIFGVGASLYQAGMHEDIRVEVNDYKKERAVAIHATHIELANAALMDKVIKIELA